MDQKALPSPNDIAVAETGEIVVRKKQGRPTKYTKQVVEDLVDCIRRQMSDQNACEYAGIDRWTFYNWLRTIPEFSHKIKQARLYLLRAAGTVVANAIIEDKNPFLAKWYLEKKEPKIFGNQQPQAPPAPNMTQLNINFGKEMEKYAD